MAVKFTPEKKNNASIGYVNGLGLSSSTRLQATHAPTPITKPNSLTYDELLSVGTEGVNGSEVVESGGKETESASGVLPSYSEFLRGVSDKYEDNYQSTIRRIDEENASALAEIEKARVQGLRDADASYQQNLATYGANAEALSKMGLTGSGYADYLNAQAYASKRADQQAIRSSALSATNTANENAAEARRSAEETYLGQLLDLEERKATYQQGLDETAKGMYTELLAGANSGAYSAEQLAQLASDYRLSSKQTQSLVDSAGKYREGLQNENFDTFVSYFNSGDFDEAEVDRAVQRGDISQEHYGELKTMWNDKVIVDASAFKNEDGSIMDAAEAEKLLSEYTANSFISLEKKAAVQQTYDSIYSEIKTISGLEYNYGLTKNEKKTGRNFSLKGPNGKKYRIEIGEYADEDVVEKARNQSDNSVFAYRGKIYMKRDGEVFEIRRRQNNYGEHYEELYNLFYGE